jgi:hypothetical protein
MQLNLFRGEDARREHAERDVVRAEVAIVNYDEQQWKVILLDAEDSFDVVIHYPTSEREIIWSLAREPVCDLEDDIQ